MIITQKPIYQLFPELTESEFESLKKDIAERGILVPVEKDEAGNILDGHHRIRAWEELKAEGVKVPDYPCMIRAGLTEQEKLSHVRTLNLLRRHLTTEQQKPHWEEMRKSGMTYQAIAEVSGVSHMTVKRELTNVNSEIISTNGKKRPAQYKPRTPKTVITTNASQEKNVTEAIGKVGSDALPDKVIPGKRAERVCREAEADQRRQETEETLKANPESTKNGIYDIRHGRFQVVLSDIENNSINLICTDPPYGKDFLNEWNEFADLANRVLKPGAFLVTYSGQMYLPAVMSSLASKLRYVWTIAQINGSSKKNIVTQNKIYSQWKPLLVFCKEPFSPLDSWLNDTLTGEEREKDFHDWQQGLSEAEFIINTFSKVKDTVLDPFLGSGTTALAAIKNGRNIIGCDSDAACISQAMERINVKN